MIPFWGKGIQWMLVIAVVILAVFHVSARLFEFDAPQWSWLDGTAHTSASVWVRIGSIPLRLALLVFLSGYLYQFRPGYAFTASTHTVLLQLWTICCGYYVADLVLFTAALPMLQSVLALAFVTICLLVTILVPDKVYLPALLLIAGLTALVLYAQQQSGENNAFTLFGLQGLAFIAACIRPAWTQRLVLGFVLIPSFGYLFPVAEKLMLNPIGWLSGTTFQAFADILGYPLSYPTSLLGSWLLLIFQSAFLLVLTRPERAFWLYPVAIIFHLTAGLTLGFGAVLNPWIVSLGLSWTALQCRENTVHA